VSAPLPPARSNFVCAIVGTTFYIFGGKYIERHMGDLWAFDLSTRMRLIYQTSDYSDHSISVFSLLVYVFFLYSSYPATMGIDKAFLNR
jgi:hypothetical protein